MAVKLGIAHPRLGQEPVPLRVIGQEDGAIGPGGLAELGTGKEGRSGEGRDPHTQGSPLQDGSRGEPEEVEPPPSTLQPLWCPEHTRAFTSSHSV